MGTLKKTVPSLALLLLLLLGEGTLAFTTDTKISNFTVAKEKKQIIPGQVDINTYADNQAEFISTQAVKLSNSRNREEALKLFDRSIEIAQKLSSPSSKIATLSEIALKLSEARQTKRSSQIFNQAINLAQRKSQDFSEYEKLDALRNISIKMARAGFINRALDLGKKIPGNLPKAQVFNEVSVILLEAGKRQQSQKVLQQALQHAQRVTEKENSAYEANGSCANDKFDILSKIAANLSLQAQLNKALQVAQSVSGCSSANGEYTQDYQAWAFLGILNHLKRAEAIKQTWNASQKIKSMNERDMVWSGVAVKMAEIGETKFALSIAKTLQNSTQINNDIYDIRNFLPRERMLANIGIKLAQKRHFDAAMSVAQMMKDNNQALPELLRDAFPTPSPKTTVLVEIVQQMTSARQAAQAINLANNITESTDKTLVQIALADSLQKSGQQTQATQIFQNLSLPKTPEKPNDFNGYEAHRQVAIALAKAKQIDKFLEVSNSIQNSLAKESTLTDIAIQLADIGEIQPALNLIKFLDGEGSKLSVNNKVVMKLTELGQLEQALQIANSQKELDAALLSNLAEKFAFAGQKEQAIKTAEIISDEDFKAKTLAGVALVLAK